ncbi:MAG: response regulator transcription factor [Tepidiformaceae bacterium]
MTGAHILIIDDETAILRAVKRPLEHHGYTVATLDRGGGATAELRRFRPDVVVLDLVLPDIDGLTVCSAIRAESAVPIIVLSAIGDDAKKVQALDNGADDYLVKPFSMDELEARIRVALRRSANQPTSTVLTAGALHLDLATRSVDVGGTELHLTPREFALLRLLMEQRGRVLTQHQILASVWGPEYADDSHILRTFVHQLRSKIAAVSPVEAALIVTDPGVGYRLEHRESGLPA